MCQWALQSRPERLSAFFGPEQINLMIFSIYLACISSIFAIVFHPRLVNLEKRQKNKTMPKVCILFLKYFFHNFLKFDKESHKKVYKTQKWLLIKKVTV